MLRLIDTPDDARFLAPLLQREIIYRLLMGEQGDRVRQITTLGGDSNRISTAIDRLRTDFDKPMRVDALAQRLQQCRRLKPRRHGEGAQARDPGGGPRLSLRQVEGGVADAGAARRSRGCWQ